MNKDLKKKATRAIGHFALNVNENNEGHKPVPTSRLMLGLSTDQFYVAGFADKNLDSQGADIYISGKIEANKTYLFESEGARGNYNPAKFEGSSWSSRSGSGEIKIDEIDWEIKPQKAVSFLPPPRKTGANPAEINGNFNLQQ